MPFQKLKKFLAAKTPLEAAKQQLAHAQAEKQRSRLLAEEFLAKETYFADHAQRLSMFIMENDDSATPSTLEAAAVVTAAARKPKAKAATAGA